MAVKKNRSTENFKDISRQPSRANIAQNISTKNTRRQPETNSAPEENTQLREQVKQFEKRLTTHINQKSNLTWKTFATLVDNQKNLNGPQSHNMGTPTEISEVLGNTIQILNGFAKLLTQPQNTTQTHTGM